MEGTSLRIRRTITLLGFIAIAAAAFSTTAIPAAAKDGIAKRAAKGDLKPAILTTQTASGQTIQKQMPFLSDSTIISAKAALNGEDEDKDVAADAAAGGDFGLSGSTSTGSGPGALGCSSRDKGKGNKRVNQDCTFRRQAEESIAFNPANPVQLNAGQNDSRVGYNQCGIDFSTDNGKHWGDMLPPFRQHENHPASQEPAAHPGDPNRHTMQGAAGGETAHTYDFGSDPTVAFDADGRAFFSCLGIDVN